MSELDVQNSAGDGENAAETKKISRSATSAKRKVLRGVCGYGGCHNSISAGYYCATHKETIRVAVKNLRTSRAELRPPQKVNYPTA